MGYPNVELASFLVHHRVVHLRNENELRWLRWELLKAALELESALFVESVPHEHDAMPLCLTNPLPSTVSSCGTT